MTPEHLDNIIQCAPETLKSLMGEIHEDILDAARSSLDDDGKGKCRVSCVITIDVGRHPPVWTAEAAVSIRRKAVSAPVESDSTPDLPGLMTP